MKKLIEGTSKLGMELSARQVQQFEIYCQELLQWNKKYNLTAITDYQAIQTKHFLDSLTVTLALDNQEISQPDFTIIDIGTGAGFPGLPVKIAFPNTKLVLIESVTKKTAFLHHIIRKLELDNVKVITGRAEEIARSPAYRERFALALSRAVALLQTLVELALPFCRVSGKFVAYKKGRIEQEIEQASKAITILGGKLSRVEKIVLQELGDERYLVIIDKIYPTLDKYPRRPGLAKRCPIRED